MWQAGSTGSACTHSLLSGNTDTCPLSQDGPDPPSHMCSWAQAQCTQKQLPVYPCHHTLTHTYTYLCSHNLSIQQVTNQNAPAALTTCSSNSTPHQPNPGAPLPTASLGTLGCMQSLIQHDFRRHCSLTVLNLFKPHGPRNAHSVIYLSREAGLNQGQIQLYHSSPGQVIVFQMMTLAIPTS